MPGKSIQTIDRESLAIRKQMQALMESEGLSESQALLRALPNDSNRSVKFRLWIAKGLWPILSSTNGTTNTTQANNIKPAPVRPPANKASGNGASTINSNTCLRSQENAYPAPPKFIGPKVTTSVKISYEIQKRALYKARTMHGLKTRGNMSGLIEYLFWEYTGCDPALIKK